MRKMRFCGVLVLALKTETGVALMICASAVCQTDSAEVRVDRGWDIVVY